MKILYTDFPIVYNKSMKKTVRRIIIAVIIILVVFCGVTYFVTPLFMVHPNSSPEAVAKLKEMPGVSEVSIGDDLKGWFVDDPSTEDLIIYFGGNTENASSAALRLMNYKEYLEGFDIAVVDWPGYGISNGKATSDSLRESALAILEHFQDVGGRIIVFGYSMGTGPAVYCTSQSDVVDGLILMSPYASAYDLYNSKVPVFYGPMRLLLSFRMDSAEYAANVDLEPFIITSRADRLVPYKTSMKLAEAFPNGAYILELDDLSHSGYWSSEEVMWAIKEHLKRD